jgi:hypothetical protein
MRIDFIPGFKWFISAFAPKCVIGAAIGAGAAAIGAGLSALGGARAARQKRRELAKQERENNAWYDQRYNELGTERADAQAALSAMRAAQAQRMSAARGTEAVMGASAGSVAAEKAGANMAMGQTISQMNANNEKNKMAIENAYLQRKNDISNRRLGMYEAQSQNLANAGSQLSQLGASIAGSGLFDKKKNG